MYMLKNLSYILPVIVSITQCSDRNLECLPHWIQCIFHNFCFVADCKTAVNTKNKDTKNINTFCIYLLFLLCHRRWNGAVIIHTYHVHIKYKVRKREIW